jgi:Fe2+ or Zn2+ uptake regulation protein
VLASREQIAEQLRRSGLRATGPRVSVYAAVASLDGHHPGVQAILARVHEGGEAVSTQAVYDCLGVLSAAGLLRRIQPAGSPARYETRVADNHHHVVCRACGATEDIDCAVGEAPCLEPSGAAGFTVEQAEVTFWGLCPECQSAAGQPGEPAENFKAAITKTPAGRTTKP